nr:hypothetical protein [Acidiferrobacter thiooxydans]
MGGRHVIHKDLAEGLEYAIPDCLAGEGVEARDPAEKHQHLTTLGE